MADGFDSHALSSSSDLSNSLSVKMKDEISISDDTHVPKVTDFESIKKEETITAKMKDEMIINVGASETQDFEVVAQSVDESIKKEDTIKSLNLVGSKDEENVGASETQEFEVKDNTHVTDFESIKKEENLVGSKDDGSVRCSLKIEVIDDTAMIDISQLGKTCSLDKKIDGKSGRNRKKKNVNNLLEKEKKVAKEKNVLISDGYKRKGGEEKRVYSREELENLRFIGMEEQRKMWVEVYCGLGHTVQKEYDGLLHIPRRHLGKENTPLISGNDHSEHLDDQEGNIDTRNSPLAFPLSRDDDISYEGESYVYEESDDSDDDYSSIQRPAFRVTGEPDFDSGPPEDGFEYLRRVRWEALRLPKVKVATVQGSKLNKEQTSYMPQIPDIASCLEHLLPLKEWEEAFVADFSELRQALSRLEANDGTSSPLHSATFVDQQHSSSDQLPENIVLDKFDGLMSRDEESCLSDAGDDPVLENSVPKSSPAGGFGNSPTLSVILRMDAVVRVSMLRKRITALQSMTTLSRDDCLWLYALCAAVDTPVDADTCAALRSLLRKCASLRADKAKLDDEVIMLNMLVTISGRYFGQSEQ
ncbi:uncharacterized protein LOC132609384 [Lycium barbarum]|uniref:uncharacterized protein LOC132609384 n=1 Tax=Lycium barbarum TaxID=112863 RepID=UPI00293ECF81|nr:uncharacterized protein LOC132609384 [Lycium barbarum]